jgi:glutathione peroxidase
MSDSFFDLTAQVNNGKEISFKSFEGKAVLVINTASKCGFTPQYKGLEELHQKYKDKGLVVLGFPCNQFGHQEPGSDTEIAAFCSLNFGVTFQLMSKIDVNGAGTHPVYEFLKKKVPGTIKWNFTKFLVGRDGTTVVRFASTIKPEKLEKDVEAALSLAPTKYSDGATL